MFKTNPYQPKVFTLNQIVGLTKAAKVKAANSLVRKGLLEKVKLPNGQTGYRATAMACAIKETQEQPAN